MTLAEMRQKRGEAVHQMRAILDKTASEDRDMNSDEQTQWTAWDEEQAKLGERIGQEEKVSQVLAELAEPVDRASRPSTRQPNPMAGIMPTRPNSGHEYIKAYDQFLRKGLNGIGPEIYGALQVGTNSEGGFVVPEEFETQLVIALENVNVMRQLSTVIRTQSDRHIPVEATRGTAAWTAEEAAYNESDAAFGRVTLEAFKLTRIMKVSEELLMDAFFDLESFVSSNFARAFGVAEESSFVNGDGSAKPTGVVVGSTLGVTAAGATAITSDELIDLFHSLKRIYRSNGTFLAADGTIKLIRKLKDGDSQYIWQPGLQAGEPDRLLGRPIFASDGMPAATTGLKSVLFADMSYYYIADRVGIVMQRLNELYAATGQIGFKMYERTDGKLTLAEAAQHLIQA